MAKLLPMVGLLTMVLQQTGCSRDVRFDPEGCDVQIVGRWFVDGENPDLDTCGSISAVELAIINDQEDQFWSVNELLLRCNAADDSNAVVIDGGAFLNTILVPRGRCGGGGEILEDREGPYKYRWRAITNLNFITDCTPISEADIVPVDVDGGTQLILELPDVDFQTMDAGTACPDGG